MDPELLTIGEFARSTRLSPKALRLYDELGLLRPAAVDAGTGYRLYHPDQAERARLIVWLRRLGMPLAGIRQVCDADPATAAGHVGAFWDQVRADTAVREQLAAFLIDHLTGRGTTMGTTHPRLGIRYAARSESGLVRTSNADTAYAGTRLLAVADGVGGATGHRASTAAVDALKPLETVDVPAADVLGALTDAIAAADRAVGDIDADDRGTTLTALLWTGSQLALAHIGDTRAYRLRDGDLAQITHDHTWVQSQVDQGHLSPQEAATHPQRALLVRAITGTGDPRPDLALHTAEAGDRYLLCSDGLSSVVPTGRIHDTLRRPDGPQQILDQLITLATAAGAPDNIACVVADVVAV